MIQSLLNMLQKLQAEEGEAAMQVQLEVSPGVAEQQPVQSRVLLH